MNARPPAELAALIGELITELSGLTIAEDQSFFAAGLTSATVVALHQRLVERLGIAFDVTKLFKYPSIRALARFLADPASTPAAMPRQNWAPPGPAADARRELRARIRQRNR